MSIIQHKILNEEVVLENTSSNGINGRENRREDWSAFASCLSQVQVPAESLAAVGKTSALGVTAKCRQKGPVGGAHPATLSSKDGQVQPGHLPLHRESRNQPRFEPRSLELASQPPHPSQNLKAPILNLKRRRKFYLICFGFQNQNINYYYFINNKNIGAGGSYSDLAAGTC